MYARGVTAAFEPTAPVSDLRVGELLAHRYEVLALLGVGGMGTVYRVLDRELDEEAALKVLDPALAAAPDALARFRREVKLARRVTHPNVARTYDLGVHGKTFFLTMELLPGVALTERMSGEVVLPEVLRVAQEIARGLAAAHAVGVVHRDLKPDNVMLVDERVVITDFGIARLAEGHREATQTQTQTIIGTPAYMAPEQIEAGVIDGRTDVYALGVVLFEMTTGALPFGGNTPFAMAAARLTDRIPDPRALRPGLPPGVAQLVLSALARRREDRPDAQTLADRLATLRGVGVPDAVVGARASTTVAAPTWSPDASDRRVVAVRALDAEPGRERLGADLERAVVDTLTAEPGVRVVAAGAGEVPPSTLVLDGSVRVVGRKARVRLRLAAPGHAAPQWADVVEGDPDDPFALEDAVADRTRAAVQKRLGSTPGPADPALRERYDRARAAYERFEVHSVHEAIVLLEELHAERPGDPSIMALLACAVTREWRQLGASDEGTLARAEELALRALDADPSLGETYHAIGLIRSAAGDFRAGLRAIGEALRRSPLNAEAHSVVAQLRMETGHLDDALARAALAARIDPHLLSAQFTRIWVFALRGDRGRAEEALAAAARGGNTATVLLESRLAYWWHDREMADRVAEQIERSAGRASWGLAAPLLRAYAAGQRYADDGGVIGKITSTRVAPRHRCMMHEVATEYFLLQDEPARALGEIERAVVLPYLNLAWLDGCPLLEPIRPDPRFAAARAVVAARAASLWE